MRAPALRLTWRRAAPAVAALLAIAATWQLGSGFYIYGKALLAQHLLQDAWRRTAAGDSEARPWAWADFRPVARLTAPAHGADLIVLSDASGAALAFGPGHVATTPPPGAIGNSVIGGHRDTNFRFLARLRVGDALNIERADGGDVGYRVIGTRIVDSRMPWRRPVVAYSRMLTLVTCYPFDAVVPGGPLRYLVTAEETGLPAGIR